MLEPFGSRPGRQREEEDRRSVAGVDHAWHGICISAGPAPHKICHSIVAASASIDDRGGPFRSIGISVGHEESPGPRRRFGLDAVLCVQAVERRRGCVAAHARARSGARGVEMMGPIGGGRQGTCMPFSPPLCIWIDPPARRVGGWPAAGGPGVTGNRAHGRVRCTTYPCADGNTRGGGGGRRTFGGTHAWWVCLLRRGDDTGRCSACGVCLKARINLVFVSRLAVPCIGYVHKSTRINGSSQNRCSQVFVNARSLVVTRVQVTPQVLSPHSSREWIS